MGTFYVNQQVRADSAEPVLATARRACVGLAYVAPAREMAGSRSTTSRALPRTRRCYTRSDTTCRTDLQPPKTAKLVSEILRAGADVNIQDRWGQTALSLAIRRRHPATAELLRLAGAK
jgi:ankyrin repeat protein